MFTLESVGSHSVHGRIWACLPLALTALLACGDKKQQASGKILEGKEPRAATVTEAEDLCSLILRSPFETVDELDAGMGENEPVMIHFGLSFQSGRALWQAACTSFWDKYECTQGGIRIGSEFASYDRERKILSWRGIEYRQLPLERTP